MMPKSPIYNLLFLQDQFTESRLCCNIASWALMDYHAIRFSLSQPVGIGIRDNALHALNILSHKGLWIFQAMVQKTAAMTCTTASFLKQDYKY